MYVPHIGALKRNQWITKSPRMTFMDMNVRNETRLWSMGMEAAERMQRQQIFLLY